MEVYDGQVTCQKCRRFLLLKKEDIQYVTAQQYRDTTLLGGAVTITPVKKFFTVCFCSERIILKPNEISQDALILAKEEVKANPNV